MAVPPLEFKYPPPSWPQSSFSQALPVQPFCYLTESPGHSGCPESEASLWLVVGRQSGPSSQPVGK